MKQTPKLLETKALYAGLVCAVISFLLGLVVFWGTTVPILKPGVSLGSLTIVFGPLAALVVYVVAIVTGGTVTGLRELVRISALTRVWVLALAHSMLTFLVVGGLFLIINKAFLGATIDVWGASVAIAASVGAMAHWTFLAAAQMNSQRVAQLLTQFLVSGTLVSILTAGNEQWWNMHFSSLGADNGISGHTFNITLILGGLIIVGLSKYIVDDFNVILHKNSDRKKFKTNLLQIFLAGIGVMLACVGLFVYDEFPTIHNLSAYGMAVLFIVVVALLPWLTPRLPKVLYGMSFGLAAAVVFCYWLFAGIHYLNLTMFELFGSVLVFVWLILFVRHISALVRTTK